MGVPDDLRSAPRTPPRRTEGSPPDVLVTLVDRFDAGAIDAPDGRARIRLIVRFEREWDVLVDGPRARLAPADPRVRADATLTADPETWAAIARDVSGGMDAYRSGRLAIR